MERATTARKDTEPTLFDVAQFKLSEDETAIMECMDNETLQIDEIIERTALPAGRVNASLTSLQLKGLLKQLPGSYYHKKTSNQDSGQ